MNTDPILIDLNTHLTDIIRDVESVRAALAAHAIACKEDSDYPKIDADSIKCHLSDVSNLLFEVTESILK